MFTKRSAVVQRAPRIASVMALALFLGGCGSSTSAGTSSPGPTAVPRAPSTAPSTAPSVPPSASVLTVESSIADGAALTTPTAWIATIGGGLAAAPVDRVEFLIDGQLAWTEHNAPYSFNDDGNLLVPSVLDPGGHHLEVDVYTAAGKAATATLTVTTGRPAVPAALAGKSFAHEPAGPFGSWRYTFGSDGVIRFDDAYGSGGTEAFTALPDGTITFYGPTNWIVPDDRRGGFCDTPEGVTVMRWRTVGANVAITSTGADEPCPGRTSNLAGNYAPSK